MDTRRRVKLYSLDDDGKWEDKGTGQITCNYVEQKGGVHLLVKSEEDGTILLESKVRAANNYQRQQDTLIVWTDDCGELALSFQESTGCQDIWDQIVAVQHKSSPDAGESDSENGNDLSDDLSILPPANIGNVDAILDTIMVNSTPMKRDRFVLAMIKEDYIRKLLQLFSLCEDFEDKPILYSMFNIFKNLILLNDTNLMEILFSEEYMIQVMGALEYDPEISEANRMKHREFLTNSAIFKQIIPFDSADLVEKIHQTFRMQYLKDVVLNRVLDEPTCTTINNLIMFNHVEIVTQLQNDPKFIGEVFTKLKSDTATSTQRKDVLVFIHEMCNLAKFIQIPNRNQLYKTLADQGLFEVITTTLSDENVATRMACTEILNLTLSHEPSLLRGFIAHHSSELLRSLVERFTQDPEIGVKSQCAEILKILLDTDSITEDQSAVKEAFLNIFYKDHLKALVERLKKKYDIPGSRVPLKNKVNGKPGKEKKGEEAGGEKKEGEGQEKEGAKAEEKTESKHEEQEGKEPEAKRARTEKEEVKEGDVKEGEGKARARGGKEYVYGRANLDTGFVQSNVCEILSYCLRHHGYRIKGFLLQSNTVQRVLKLLHHRDAFLVLTAVRFFRVFVGTNDDFYNRFIIKHNLFAPIVQVFENNGSKYNLINSAILELFDFVRRENIKPLIPHLVENFGDMMRKVEYVDVFKLMLNKYDQLLEDTTRRSGTDKIVTLNGPRKTQKQLEEEEEDHYFKEDEEEANKEAARLREDAMKFKEMPKKDKEKEEKNAFKELTKDKKAKGKEGSEGKAERKLKKEAESERKFKETESERKFNEGEPDRRFKEGKEERRNEERKFKEGKDERKFKEAEPERKFKEGEPRKFREAEPHEQQRIKFSLKIGGGGGEGGTGEAKEKERESAIGPAKVAPGLGALVEYSSDDEEEGDGEKGQEGRGEGEGMNGRVREKAEGDKEESPSKRMRVMDEREEFPRTPPLST